MSDQPKNLNWYDGFHHFSFTWCSKHYWIALGTVTVDVDVTMYLLPSFHSIFTSHHALIYTNHETSHNWMVTFSIAEIQREFSRTAFFSFFYLQILHKYIKRCDTAMLFINEFYQKISKNHCNAFLPDLRTDYFKTSFVSPDIWYAFTLVNFFNQK